MAAAATTVKIKAQICGRSNTGVSRSLCYLATSTMTVSESVLQQKFSLVKEKWLIKCSTLKLNYQIVIHKLPLEQNDGNTNCTDPL
jgi:hypothetical protein